MTANGIVNLESHYSVAETIQRIESILQSKGVKLFALIDHSGEAEKASLTMPPTKLLIFGNPKGGTPLMQAAPSAAIDLPLKLLVAEDTNGKAQISYNDPAWLIARHNIPPELLQNIAVLKTIAETAAQ